MHPLARNPYLQQPGYNPYLPKVAFEMPSMPDLSSLASNPYVIGGLGGAGLGLGSGLLWYYLTDQAKRNALTQILLPTLGGAGLGLGAAGLYDYFGQDGGPPKVDSASVDGPFNYVPITAVNRAPEEIRDKLKIYNRVASLHPSVRGTASRLAWAMFLEGYSPADIEKALLSLQSAGALAAYESRGGVIPKKYFDSVAYDVNTLESLANRLGVASWLKNYDERPTTADK